MKQILSQSKINILLVQIKQRKQRHDKRRKLIPGTFLSDYFL